MRSVRSAGPRRRKGEARRGITRFAGSAPTEKRGHRAEVADLVLKRRGALQGPQEIEVRGGRPGRGHQRHPTALECPDAVRGKAGRETTCIGAQRPEAALTATAAGEGRGPLTRRPR